MRLLIAKLTSTSVQSVSVALNSESDIADLATDLDNCVKLLRSGGYDLVLLITSQGKLRARDAIARLRREAGRVPMVVLTEPSGHDLASLAGALGGMGALGNDPRGNPSGDPPGGPESTSDDLGHGWAWQDGARVPRTDSRPESRADSGTSSSVPGGGRQAFAPHPGREIEAVGETLRAGGREVALSQAEARLFGHLWSKRGRIVSAEDLMAAIYRDAERPASRVLPVFLFKLRRKLSGLGFDDLIETAVGRGFMIRSAPGERSNV